jgi:hypothetical protein
MTFTVISDTAKSEQKTRTYDRFSDLANDMVDVRIYRPLTVLRMRKLGSKAETSPSGSTDTLRPLNN